MHQLEDKAMSLTSSSSSVKLCIDWRTKPCHFNWSICLLKTIVVQSVNNLIVYKEAINFYNGGKQKG